MIMIILQYIVYSVYYFTEAHKAFESQWGDYQSHLYSRIPSTCANQIYPTPESSKFIKISIK